MVAAIGVVAALIGGGCSGGGHDARDARRGRSVTEPVALGDVQLVAGLRTEDTCDALLDRLRQVGLAHVGAYGFGYGSGVYSADEFVTSSRPVSRDFAAISDSTTDLGFGAGVSAGQGAGDPGFSGTNNQTAGVDEADTVKTDGRLLVVVRENRLSVVDVSAGGTGARVLGAVTVGAGMGNLTLLLSGTTAVVFGQTYPGEELSEGGFRGDGPMPASVQTTVATVDLSDPAAPKVTETISLDGELTSARMVDGQVRLVLRSQPLGFPFVIPQGEAGEGAARQTNSSIVAESTLEQWLPHLCARDTASDLLPCDRVYVPETFAGVSMTTVATLDVDSKLAPIAMGLLAPGDVSYSSATGCVCCRHRPGSIPSWPRPTNFRRSRTGRPLSIASGSVSDGSVTYVASGVVDGTIRNSFSLGEVGDATTEGGVRLGVATTTGAPWAIDDATSSSQLRVLRTDGRKLVETGAVTGLGEGEVIQSVRFVGTRAYIVTFRQDRPVLRDRPGRGRRAQVGRRTEGPRVLRLPAPSVGTRSCWVSDATRPTPASTTGLKATLFDVTDAAAPAAVGTWVDPQGFSDVAWDHHAFLYWPATNLALLPSSNYSRADGSSSLVGLRVLPGALAEVGRVTHAPTDVGATQCTKIGAEQIEATTGKPVAGGGARRGSCRCARRISCMALGG